MAEAKPKPKDDGTRSPAPAAVFAASDFSHEFRAKQVEELDEKFPEFKHMYQSPDISPALLTAKAQEVVVDSNGDILHHLGDPVVRMKKDLYDKIHSGPAEMSREAAESVMPDMETKTASPKTPKKTMK